MDKFDTMARFFGKQGQWFVELQYKRASWRTVPVCQTPEGKLFAQIIPGIFEILEGVTDSIGAERELLSWAPHRENENGHLTKSLKTSREWSRDRNRDEREAHILQASRELIQDAKFVSEVIEMVEVRGQTVMWCTVPQELKDRYHTTDMKCLDIWLERCGMCIKDFAPGQKLCMRVTSVSTRGKFNKTPIIRGIPDQHTDASNAKLPVPSAAPGELNTTDKVPALVPDSLKSSLEFEDEKPPSQIVNEKQEEDWLCNFMLEMKTLEDRMTRVLDKGQDPLMQTVPRPGDLTRGFTGTDTSDIEV